MTNEEAQAREAAIMGAPMRIAELPQDELGEDVRALVTRIGARLGYDQPEELTTYFALMAKHPGIFRCQLETGIMFFGESQIPVRERELAVLRTAWLAGAPYEWGEHVDIARKAGVTPEETDRVRIGPAAEGWSDHERTVLTAVDELMADTMITDETWQRLAAVWTEAQLIELPALVGQYLGVAMIQNSLRVPLSDLRNGFAER